MREQWRPTHLLRNFDRPEVFTGVPELIDLRGLVDPQGNFRFDFGADTGHGGVATHAAAKAASARELQCTGANGALPDGRLLILRA